MSSSSRKPYRLVAILAGILLVTALPGAALASSPNQPPIAVDDPGTVCGPSGLPGQPPPFGGAYPLPEDYVGTFAPTDYFILLCGPLQNDTDPDGDPLTWEIVTPPAHGDIQKFDETIFGYRPDPDYSTKPGDVPGGDWYSDSFTYRAFDGQAYSNVATWRYWVAPVNDPPTYTPGDDVWVTQDSGTYHAQWATNVSPGPANESDQTVRFQLRAVSGQTIGDGPLFATLPSIDSDGVLSFTLTPGAYGFAHVTFWVQDDGGTTPNYAQGTNAPQPNDFGPDASFTVFVQQRSTLSAEDDVVQLSEDPSPNPWPVAVLANDTVPPGATITSVRQGQKGSVSIAPDGQSLFYAPSADANGADSFTYTLSDGSGSDDTAIVFVTIDPVNDDPIARPDALTLARNASATTVPVLANDTDVDGDTLTITGVTNGSMGTVAIIGGGTGLTYLPARNMVGTDSFGYTVSDGHGGTATTTVSVGIVHVKGPKG